MIDLSKALTIDGWVEPDELQRIAEWASNRHRIIEIGSWKGRTTRTICDNTDDLVVTIDHWKGALEPVDDGFWEVDKYGPDYVYNMFTTTLSDHLGSGKLKVYKMPSEDAARLLIGEFGFGYFDMVWIDGGHEYEIVKKDIVYFRPLLRMGGQLCGHDWYYPGVSKAVKELFPQYWQSGNLWSKET